MRILPYIGVAFLLAVLAGLVTCRDAPRDNPFDPESTVLLVSVVSPGDSGSFRQGETISFSADVRTGLGVVPSKAAYLWRSDRSGVLSRSLEFTTDSLPVGVHHIVFTVSDSLYGQGEARLTLVVLAGSSFSVFITFPPRDTTIRQGTVLQPAAREQVPQGSTVAGRLWKFGVQSGLPDLTVKDPPRLVWAVLGPFEVVYQVVDDLGRVAADTVIITVSGENQPPTARIMLPSKDTTLVTGDSVFFLAVDKDPEGSLASRSWIYQSGSGLESLHDTVPVPGWRTFSKLGPFQVIYRVADVMGLTGEDTVTVTVNNRPPSALIVSPASDTTVYIYDSLSLRGQDQDLDGQVVSRQWNYRRNGGALVQIGTTATPGYFRFDYVASYRLYYSVADNLGGQGIDSVSVTVLSAAFNRNPLARIIHPSVDTTVAGGANITFVGSDSDLDGSVVARKWLYPPGSGLENSKDTSAATPPKIFGIPGYFMVIYQVTDNRNGQGADTIFITVTPNIAPQAMILAPQADTTIAQGDSVRFAGFDSDLDGQVVARRWSYGAGSGIDASADTTASPGYRKFNIPNTFDVTYTVTDNKGISSSSSRRVTVNPNIPPTVAITLPSADTTVYRRDSVLFVANDNDPDGTVVRRQWSWGTGSGIDSTRDTTATPGKKAFAAAGTYTVRYKATDNKGGVSTDQVVVTVLAAEGVALTVGSKTASKISVVTVPISVGNPDGGLTRLQFRLSWSPAGLMGLTALRKVQRASSLTLTHSELAPGTRSITLDGGTLAGGSGTVLEADFFVSPGASGVITITPSNIQATTASGIHAAISSSGAQVTIVP